ncbi:hypothetical protein [Mumia sp. Pv 4-285]|uniref:hypothetical protein n=1 Tax=Mumia qirimensis TaxID=3234852 RepID=UPI00351CE6A6
MSVRFRPHRPPCERRVGRPRDERGDVPGWVMITVMSAGLVAGLTAIAGPQLKAMLEAALSSVSG